MFWRAPWNELRQKQALNCNLLQELQVDETSYRRYIRMDKHHFEDLMGRVAPVIARRNTNFHDAISVGERLDKDAAPTNQSAFLRFRYSNYSMKMNLPICLVNVMG